MKWGFVLEDEFEDAFDNLKQLCKSLLRRTKKPVLIEQWNFESKSIYYHTWTVLKVSHNSLTLKDNDTGEITVLNLEKAMFTRLQKYNEQVTLFDF